MFIVVNPSESISERQKHLRTSAIRSHTASVQHRRRQYTSVPRSRPNAQDNRHDSALRKPASVYRSTVTMSPRFPILLTLHKRHEIDDFQYFLECGLPHISSLYDYTFWQDIFIPLVWSNSSLQYAMSALGTALRIWHSQQARTPVDTPIHYEMQLLAVSNRAFRQFMVERDLSPLTSITACIIFIITSSLSQGESRVRQHFKHGAAMFKEYYIRRSRWSSRLDKHIFETLFLPIFQGLSAIYGAVSYLKECSDKDQLGMRNGSVSVGNELVDVPNLCYLEGPDLALPDNFSSVHVSGQWLWSIAQSLTAQLKEITDISFANILKGTQFLARAKALTLAWRARFNKFMVAKVSQLDTTARAAAYHQDAYFHYICIQLETVYSIDEMAFDVYESYFQAITTSCRSYLILVTGEDITLSQRPFFRLDSYILPLLCFTAHHCRHPLVRRQAVELMENYDQFEAHTPGTNLAIWSRYLIEIEERDCQRPPRVSADIASWQRVRSMDLTSTPPRPGDYHYSQDQFNDRGQWLVNDGHGGVTIRLQGRLVLGKPPIAWRYFINGSAKFKAYNATVYSAGRNPQQP